MIAALLFTLAVQHDGLMPGMTMPMPRATTKALAKPAAKPSRVRKPVVRSSSTPAAIPHEPAPPAVAADPCSPEHAAMGHCKPAAPLAGETPPAAPATPTLAQDACPPEHAAMGHCKPAATTVAVAEASGTDLPVGNAAAPAPPIVDYGDARWSATAMGPVRAAMMAEHGGGKFSKIMVDLFEAQFRDARDGYRWEGEAWFGGDIDRLVLRSEGRGDFKDGVDDAEAQALWSHAIGPYFDLQVGGRYDFKPTPSRAYATIGFEGLAPYWFEVGGALFLSDHGDLLARTEAWYDQRITQRLILQPRTELNFAAQDDRRSGIGSGISDLELGLRLRYEVVREFAPYVGVSWDRKLGDSARFARATGRGASDTSLVAGVRFWF